MSPTLLCNARAARCRRQAHDASACRSRIVAALVAGGRLGRTPAAGEGARGVHARVGSGAPSGRC